MAIRAYRVNKIEYEPTPSFDFWNDEEFVEFLRKGGVLPEDENVIDIPVCVLEEALKTELIMNEVRESIKADIKWAKEQDREYVQYICL